MNAYQHFKLARYYRQRYLQIGRSGAVAAGAPLQRLRDYHELFHKARQHERAALAARERVTEVVGWWAS